jgi:UDP-2,4-diacetamido-2,4,6-trideoxy-beta-L-altropyranose hydrolase
MAHGAPRILVLADCGPEIGGGHVMRCLSLAQALTAAGAVCAFVTTPDAARVLDAFAPAGLERRPIPDGPLHQLVEATAHAAGDWAADVVLVDHYGVGARQERLFRGEARRLVRLDDLAGVAHDCDLLIDATLGRDPDAYQAMTPSGCRVLCGPSYALLRPEYAAARPAALARRRTCEPPRRLFVSLGLTDLRGITGRVMNLLGPQLGGLEVDIAVGSAASSLTFLRRLADDNPQVRLHLDARNMAELIGAADIGVGAGGASVWERATLGLPSLNLVLAANQAGLAAELEGQGAVLAVDARSPGFGAALAPAFARLLGEPDLRARLSSASASLCDGQGAGRAAQAILALLA